MVALGASVGAAWGLVDHDVNHGSAHLLPGFARYVAYVALTQLVGAAATLEALGADGTSGNY
jgi:hypothetical protein